MTLKLFSSGSRKKEPFRSHRRGHVSIYVCGVTPYDTTHLGHAFTYLSFDVLIRYLKFKGFGVTYAQNVTDIDDDILSRARQDGREWRELGRYWTEHYLNDMKSLNIAMPDHYIKATDAIPMITRMISELLKGKHAYKSGGNVYFDVSSFPRYGELSHFSQKQMAMLLKERGGNPGDPNKRNPLDFILWQKWKRGEPSWSPDFGRGRPGWHIECSAMIEQYLGDQIDIHGGGRDLIFPHHESEIAQSESYTGKHPFVKYFVHTGTVMYMGEKMAKSLGNLVMVSELLKSHSPRAVRWLLLSHHYRKPWEYMADDIYNADIYAKKVDKLMRGSGVYAERINKKLVSAFERVMDDDLDTPAALDIIKVLLMNGKEKGTARYLLGILGFASANQRAV